MIKESTLAEAPTKSPAPVRGAHSEADQERFAKLAEQDAHFIRIDPSSKQPYEEAKEFFWKITAVIPRSMGFNDEEFRIQYQVQKYHRDEKMAVDVPINPGSELTKKKYAPWFKRKRDGSLHETGEMILDADDFLARFKME